MSSAISPHSPKSDLQGQVHGLPMISIDYFGGIILGFLQVIGIQILNTGFRTVVVDGFGGKVVVVIDTGDFAS